MAHSSLWIRSRVWPQSAWPLHSHSWLGFSGSYSVSSWRSRAASVVPQEVGHGALSPAHEYGIGGAVDMLVLVSRSLSRMWEGAILAVFVMSRNGRNQSPKGKPEQSQRSVLGPGMQSDPNQAEEGESWCLAPKKNMPRAGSWAGGTILECGAGCSLTAGSAPYGCRQGSVGNLTVVKELLREFSQPNTDLMCEVWCMNIAFKWWGGTLILILC